MTLRFQSSSAIKNILSGSNCTEFQHFKFISIASYTCVVAKMSKTKDNEAGPPGEVKKVNLDDQGALNGLRGYAAFYILVFHAVLFSDLSTHLHASVSMNIYCIELFIASRLLAGPYAPLLFALRILSDFGLWRQIISRIRYLLWTLPGCGHCQLQIFLLRLVQQEISRTRRRRGS